MFASATISISLLRVKMADLQEKLVPVSFPSKGLTAQVGKLTSSELNVFYARKAAVYKVAALDEEKSISRMHCKLQEKCFRQKGALQVAIFV